jgi:thiol-disulfide isomerase/thioredoxin
MHGIIGQQAPELMVKEWVNAEGEKIGAIHLADFKDKKVVIYGFQSWCPGCHSRGLPTLKALVKKYKGRDDIVFLAIQTVFEGFDANTYEKMLEVQKQYELEIPFGHDVGDETTNNKSSVMHQYQSGGTPWFIVLNDKHEVVFNDFHIDEDIVLELIES